MQYVLLTITINADDRNTAEFTEHQVQRGRRHSRETLSFLSADSRILIVSSSLYGCSYNSRYGRALSLRLLTTAQLVGVVGAVLPAIAQRGDGDTASAATREMAARAEHRRDRSATRGRCDQLICGWTGKRRRSEQLPCSLTFEF